MSEPGIRLDNLTDSQKNLRSLIRGFLLGASPAAMQRELEISEERGDLFRAAVIREFMAESDEPPAPAVTEISAPPVSLHGRDLFEAPNLDDLSTDPADLDTAACVFRLLAEYADGRAHAMRARLAGDVNRALKDERFIGSVYKQLPEWAKW